jgi:hypothetical protein
MIFLQWKCCLSSCAIIAIFIAFSAFYAYSVNDKRAPDDPKKKDFSPFGLWLAPVILPPLVVFNVIVLIFSSLAFGVFLLLFPLALVLFRKPFLIKWILKQAQRIGNMILIVNTELLKMVGIYPKVSIKLQIER